MLFLAAVWCSLLSSMNACCFHQPEHVPKNCTCLAGAVHGLAFGRLWFVPLSTDAGFCLWSVTLLLDVVRCVQNQHRRCFLLTNVPVLQVPPLHRLSRSFKLQVSSRFLRGCSCPAPCRCALLSDLLHVNRPCASCEWTFSLCLSLFVLVAAQRRSRLRKAAGLSSPPARTRTRRVCGRSCPLVRVMLALGSVNRRCCFEFAPKV
jgi:hypothetical protein